MDLHLGSLGLGGDTHHPGRWASSPCSLMEILHCKQGCTVLYGLAPWALPCCSMAPQATGNCTDLRSHQRALHSSVVTLEGLSVSTAAPEPEGDLPSVLLSFQECLTSSTWQCTQKLVASTCPCMTECSCVSLRRRSSSIRSCHSTSPHPSSPGWTLLWTISIALRHSTGR